jgi:pimeloyl-ACP methyl ester carboxylesterase
MIVSVQYHIGWSLLKEAASWMDHPRDILHMVNSFRSEMPLPIAGIGHSYGGNNLVNVSLMHPRLFSSLILLDPVIQGSGRKGDPSPNSEKGPARSSTWRRDLWPSREVAVAGFRKSPFYKAWDPRVLEAWIKFGICDTPTLLYPNEKGSVTLTCTKHQELFTFLRPMYNDPANGPYENADVPDLDPMIPKDASFYRPEPNSTMHRLPHLRAPALYIFGETSDMSTPELQSKKLDITGVGVGGSGGVSKGAVDSVTLKGIGHLVAMEAPSQCAGAAAPWIGKEVQKWAKEAERYREWTKQSTESKITISEEWKKHMGGDPRLKAKGKL